MEAGNSDPPNSDYDLNAPITSKTGLRQGLASYGDAHFSLFLRKVFIKAAGYGEDALSRPIIGIINTFSGFNPCHANVPQLIEAAKRGVQLHGGLAIEFPTISIHESFSSPTSMYLRNLMAMDTGKSDGHALLRRTLYPDIAFVNLCAARGRGDDQRTAGRCMHHDRWM